MKTIMSATANPAKLKELAEVLALCGIEIRPQDGTLEAPEENGQTFAENALIKAKAYARASGGMPVLADDSGLSVNALDGFPGVFSARFAEEVGGYSQAFAELERKLVAASAEDHACYFICVLCLYVPETETHKFYEGICRGRLAFPADGEGGFGYDPIFIPDGYASSFARLSKEVKAKESHRAKALQLLIDDLRV